MWKKTRSNYGGSCYGVDPNKNFDANWGVVGSSTNPCSDTYAGPSAGSEPITQALTNYVKGNANRLKVFTNYC